MAKRRHTRSKRRNPAGGFFAGLLGLLTVPTLTSLGLLAVNRATAPESIGEAATRVGAAHGVGAVASFAATGAKDPGIRSFAKGAAISEGLLAVLAPIATTMVLSERARQAALLAELER